MRCLTWLLLSCASLAAQNASLSGVVLDATGSAVPQAAILVTNEDTGAQLRLETNVEGIFLAPSLPPGRFTVEAARPGFATARAEHVVLEAQQVRRIQLTLQLSQIATRIEVVDSPVVLDESVAVASNITREQINTLPLNSRDFNQLVLLAAGAVENINSGNGRDFGGVAVNGNRAFSNDYLIDGVPNNDVYQGRSAIPVSIDLIREFRVTSLVAPAEYGQAGTQVSVVSRGGTNRFHGSAFEYYRGTTWQARNPFNFESAQPFSRHQFGGSFGGPIVRNRAFFFLNYEGNRQRETQTRVATVPPAEFWRGDFSSLLARNIQLRDPFTAGRPVIPGNRFDQYRGGALISPTAQKLQPFWGTPNQPGLSNNSIRNVQETTDSRQYSARGDFQLPASNSLGLRYTGSTVANLAPNLIGNGSGLDRPLDNANGSLMLISSIRPTLVNEFRFGGAWYYSPTIYVPAGLPTVATLGLQGFEPAGLLIPPLPRITFSGGDAFTQLNYGTNPNFGMASLLKESRTFTTSDTLSWISGRHAIKTGFEWRHVLLPALQQSNARGSLTFRAASSGLSTGYAFADFLLGIPSSTQEVPLKSPVVLKQDELSTFIQDDWRVSTRLTLSVGVRHELFLNPTEERSRLAMFDIGTGGIVVASRDGKLPEEQFLSTVVAKLRRPDGSWAFPLMTDVEAGLEPGRLLRTRYKYFGPRAGFAWQPTSSGRNVIRGGYGIFYTRYPRQYLLQTLFINPPFAGVFNHTNSLQPDGTALLTLERPFPSGRGSATVSPAGMQRDFGLPYNQQWHLTVERNLGWDVVGALSYVGNRGVHLFRSINANAAHVDPATGQIIRNLSAAFGTAAVNYRQTDGDSIYSAMLLEMRRRAGRRLTFQGNWTWAKGLDDTGSTVQAALLDVQNLGRDRANSDYVRRHQVTINSTWDLPVFAPGGSLASRWLAGWRAAGIWRYTTGRYFTPQFTAIGGLSNSRPDVLPGVRANLPRGERTPQRWFNAAAFAEVPAIDAATGRARFGNAGRNILIGPGLNTADASLAKRFPALREDHRIWFRLEAFNVFNHANYDLPESNISNTNQVGVINDIVTPMRQVQFAIRYEF
ncbi:MAG TPA: carboxypeptidase regulatory-like domain-containing protein [Bryobacteraceae bacterium]|nr:carboxypeptidase regulatory-like domain-containing protein [Bryobacteraceae bacterium]